MANLLACRARREGSFVARNEAHTEAAVSFAFSRLKEYGGITVIKLGVNSVLFGGFDFATAAKHIKMAGYDGVEMSAIKGMCEHLELDRWREQAAEISQ